MEIVIGLIVIYVVYLIIKSLSSTDKVPGITLRVEVTGSDEYEDYARLRGKPARWYENGSDISIKGHEVSGGLVYVGEVLLDAHGYDNDACLINPKLEVSPAEPWDAGDEMGYWPHYSHIPTKCRGAFLKWLAGGRVEPEAYIGYVFLFFYGLERRLRRQLIFYAFRYYQYLNG